MGIVVGFLTLFATVALLDRNLSLADAVTSNVNTVKANVGPVVLMWLVIGLLNIAGQMVLPDWGFWFHFRSRF